MSQRHAEQGREPKAGGVQVTLRREIKASLPSVVLLFSGPAVGELWPGARRVTEAPSRRWIVNSRDPDGRAVKSVIYADSPTDARESIQLHFAVAHPDGWRLAGTADLRLRSTSETHPVTLVELTLTTAARHLDRLTGLLSTYLRNLAEAAETRASAV